MADKQVDKRKAWEYSRPGKKATSSKFGNLFGSYAEDAEGRKGDSTSRGASRQCIDQISQSTTSQCSTAQASARESSIPRFNFEAVQDTKSLKELISYTRIVISILQKENPKEYKNPKDSWKTAVKDNMEPSTYLSNRIAKVCYPSKKQELVKDIVGESREVLKDVFSRGIGNPHWIAAAVLIVTSILDRTEKMIEIKEDCFTFLVTGSGGFDGLCIAVPGPFNLVDRLQCAE